MNSITIAGNLTKDCETRYTNAGEAVLTFGVADNQGKEKSAIFWTCSLFGRRAESLSPYLTRGQAVTVVGTVSERAWTDKDGTPRKSMDVRVSDVALQGGRRESNVLQPAQRQPAAPAPRQTPARQASDFSDMDDSESMPF